MWSTSGTSLGEDKLGARVGYLIQTARTPVHVHKCPSGVRCRAGGAAARMRLGEKAGQRVRAEAGGGGG